MSGRNVRWLRAFQPDLPPANGTRVLVHAFGQLQFAVVMGGSLITEDGECIEGDALDEVDVMGVVTFLSMALRRSQTTIR